MLIGIIVNKLNYVFRDNKATFFLRFFLNDIQLVNAILKLKRFMSEIEDVSQTATKVSFNYNNRGSPFVGLSLDSVFSNISAS